MNNHSSEFIGFTIQNFPNIAIRNSDNELVAYVLSQYYGSIGMLYVKPEHRRHGLATIAVSALATKLLQQNTPAYCFVEKDNEASIKLHQKCGFLTQEGADLEWLDFQPA